VFQIKIVFIEIIFLVFGEYRKSTTIEIKGEEIYGEQRCNPASASDRS
jgi:hypothetical protein